MVSELAHTKGVWGKLVPGRQISTAETSVPWTSKAIASAFAVSPTSSRRWSMSISTLSNGPSTAMGAATLRAPTVATTWVYPAEMPVTTPAWLTVATAGSSACSWERRWARRSHA